MYLISYISSIIVPYWYQQIAPTYKFEHFQYQKDLGGKKEFNRANETKIHKISFLKLKKPFRKKYPKLKIELKLISLNKRTENFR